MIAINYHYVRAVSASFKSHDDHHWVHVYVTCSFKGEDEDEHKQTFYFTDAQSARAFACAINAAFAPHVQAQDEAA